MQKTASSVSPVLKKPYDPENLNDSLRVIQLLEQLRLSSIRGNLEGVKTAIEQGISVNQTLKGGWSPLLFACSMGHPDVVEYLLKKGADPDFHKERFTALMAACASTRENEDKLVKCVDLLAKSKADVNGTERHHISALMFAAKEGHAKIVKKLISCGCTLDLQDGQGWTALFWAVNQGKVKVVEILVKAGATVEVKDRRGQTAVDLAYSKGLDEILNIFLNKDKLSDISEQEEELQQQQQLVLSSDSKFNDKYEEMIIELGSNKIMESRYERDSPGMLVRKIVGKVNGVRLKENRYKYSYLKNGTRYIGHRKYLELKNIKTDLDLNLNCNRFVTSISKASIDEPIPWNTPYSLDDAVLLMKTTMKHLGMLYAGTSYMRLRLQGRQVELPVKNKYADANGLAFMTEKALHQTQVLQDELKFLHQHVKKLEESDKIVAADIIVERRDSKYRRLTTFILISVVVVLMYNNRSNLPKIHSC